MTSSATALRLHLNLTSLYVPPFLRAPLPPSPTSHLISATLHLARLLIEANGRLTPHITIIETGSPLSGQPIHHPSAYPLQIPAGAPALVVAGVALHHQAMIHMGLPQPFPLDIELHIVLLAPFDAVPDPLVEDIERRLDDGVCGRDLARCSVQSQPARPSMAKQYYTLTYKGTQRLKVAQWRRMTSPVLTFLAKSSETIRVLIMANSRHATALITERDAVSPLFFLPQLTYTR